MCEASSCLESVGSQHLREIHAGDPERSAEADGEGQDDEQRGDGTERERVEEYVARKLEEARQNPARLS